MTGDAGVAFAVVVLAIAVWIALFCFFRQFTLWYLRINEHIDLLKDIRDALRQSSTVRSQWVPDLHGSQVAANDEVRRRPGEGLDQFNSRVADELEKQLRVR